MKKLIAAIIVLALGSIAYAQNSSNSICYTTNGRNCIPVSPDNPFPTSATLSAASLSVTQGTSPWVISGTVQPGNTPNTTSWLVNLNDGTHTAVLNACQSVTISSTSINIASATTTRIVAPTSAKHTYICGLYLLSAGTNNVAVVEGTGGTCGSGTAGVIGGATAISGNQLTAQVGFVLPNTGYAQAITNGTNVDLCLITSTNTQLSGVITWAQQ